MAYLVIVYVILSIWILTICAYINDSYWLSIQNDQLPIVEEFTPPLFRKHPRRYGQKLNASYPALYLHDKKPIFGQTDKGKNGSYCATFNVDSKTKHVCSNFRILKNNEDSLNKYYLIKPNLLDPFWDDPVGFDDRFLIIFYDYYSDSSYFGTLHKPLGNQEPVIYAVDQDGSPVEIRGRSATSSGEFVMFVVRQRPFFQSPFHGLCRPIDFPQTQADKKTLDSELVIN